MRGVDGHLSPADHALWRRVAATVRPLRPEPVAVAHPAAPAPGPATPPAPRPLAIREARAPHIPPRPPRAPHPEDATLDGGWDRRARMGRLEPDHVIDLHGHGVEHAHWQVEHGLVDAAAHGARVVLVITGKGTRGPEDRRGVIRASLAGWLQLSRLRPLIAAMRPAHPRHGGSGAFYVVLRRPR